MICVCAYAWAVSISAESVGIIWEHMIERRLIGLLIITTVDGR